MAHVILGLLTIAPQSYYDLLKAFEAGVSLFYSASSGSIKRALDRLAGDGLVEVASSGARGRKVYRITDAGRQRFGEWMNDEPTGGDLETAALPRLFFLGLVEPAERGPIVDRITARAESELTRLEALEEELDALEPSDERRALLEYQRVTLEYGLGSGRHAVEFFATLRQRMADWPGSEGDRPLDGLGVRTGRAGWRGTDRGTVR
ncbi:MAG TPA: PadR family transcriptional regulator [Candidatus Avipropionibacterium avicola]|uniref:PadR family transcriptional regulator n=1 Tax=Candidatus Avipropionibacterium avicola TaxID=2840701 RepID=A0A9D1H0Q0_9ACTN|nr:PadR family transcriptional regulator [Candidatus Avipropionibacterium avicola]